MIGYVTMGTNDLKRAAAFYDGLLAVLGARRAMQLDNFIAWGTTPTAPMISVIRPYNKLPATIGNGVMVSIAAANPEQVNKIYAKAISLGAKDEGAAGARSETFYAGYFRDMDGNKLSVFCMTTPAVAKAKPAAVTAKPTAVTAKPAAPKAKPAAVMAKPPAAKAKPAAVTSKASATKAKPVAAKAKAPAPKAKPAAPKAKPAAPKGRK